MLYMVRMTITLPDDLDGEVREQLVRAEKEYSQDLQRRGKIAGIWRVAGQYANYCLFDAGSHDELHALVSGLPMYRYIHTEVEALAMHPNAVL